VQRDRYLNDAEIRAEVAPDLTDRVDDVGANLVGDPLQLLVAQAVQILGFVDVRKKV
jgi:hypothetical protein